MGKFNMERMILGPGLQKLFFSRMGRVSTRNYHLTNIMIHIKKIRLSQDCFSLLWKSSNLEKTALYWNSILVMMRYFTPSSLRRLHTVLWCWYNSHSKNSQLVAGCVLLQNDLWRQDVGWIHLLGWRCWMGPRYDVTSQGTTGGIGNTILQDPFLQPTVISAIGIITWSNISCMFLDTDNNVNLQQI